MKRRHAILSLALVASAALVLFGDKEPAAEVVESVERTAPAAAATRPATVAVATPQDSGPAIMRLVPREELIGAAGADEGDAFHTHSWNPPPPEPPSASPPPQPVAPSVPFVLIGKTLDNGKWQIHLSQGDRIHSVRPGDVIDSVWRIDTVAPPVMNITYLPLGQSSTMNIGADQ